MKGFVVLCLFLHLGDLGEGRLENWMLDHQLLATLVEGLSNDLAKLNHVSFANFPVDCYPLALYSDRGGTRIPVRA